MKNSDNFKEVCENIMQDIDAMKYSLYANSFAELFEIKDKKTIKIDDSIFKGIFDINYEDMLKSAYCIVLALNVPPEMFEYKMDKNNIKDAQYAKFVILQLQAVKDGVNDEINALNKALNDSFWSGKSDKIKNMIEELKLVRHHVDIKMGALREAVYENYCSSVLENGLKN